VKTRHFTEPILSGPDLRQVRYFMAVARAGSIGKAAGTLRLAQPALSHQIMALERTVGTRLFDRSREGTRLTPAGAAFHRSAVRLVEALQRLVALARLAERGEFGTIRIGVGHLPLLSPRFGAAMAAIRRRHPHVLIELPLIPAPLQYRALRAGEIDIAISPPPPEDEPGIACRVFSDDPIDGAAIASTSSLAERTGVTLEQLHGHRLLIPSRRMVPHVIGPVIEALERLGFTKIEEHDSMATIAARVATGRSWTPAPHSLRGRLADGRVVIPVVGLRIPFTLHACTRRDESSSLVHNVLAVMDDLRSAEWRVSALRGADETHVAHGSVPASLEARHLRAFLALMHEGNRAHAAADLRLSEGALSRRIRETERSLGATLFDHGGRALQPTPQARALLTPAVDALRLLDEMPERARSVARGVTGRCVLGVVTPALAVVVPTVLGTLASEYAHLDVRVEEIASPRQPRDLEAGEIDVGIAHSLPGLREDAAIDGEQIVGDILDTALLPAEHPLATHSELTAMDLQRQPLLLANPSSHRAFHELVMSGLRSIGLDPTIGGYHDTLRARWSLAASGAGWVLGAHSQRENPPPGLVAIPIEGLHIPWGFDVLWRRVEHRHDVLALVRLVRGINWAASGAQPTEALLRV
jgi:DNA-binding transcriptional LysR family regulator